MESFEGASHELEDNWTAISSNGKFGLTTEQGSGVLAVAGGSHDERMGLRRAIPLNLEPGTVTLRAKVRWLQGEGRVYLRLQQELHLHMGQHHQDLAKLEYRVSPAWNWRYCWTRYRNGFAPTPQPIDKPRFWSEASVTGEITKPMPNAVLLVQVQPSNRSDNQIFKVQIDEIEIVYIKKPLVSAVLDQTCWTTGPLYLGLSNHGSATDVSCVLTDANNNVVWQQSPTIGEQQAIEVEIPRPQATKTVRDYKLSVMNSVTEEAIADWDLWLPPTSVIQTMNSWAESSHVAQSSMEKSAPRFDYWSSDIPGGRSRVDVPDAWNEVRNITAAYPEPIIGSSLMIYETLVKNSQEKTAAPPPHTYRKKTTLAFPGKRAVKIFGVRALQNIQNLEITIDHNNLPDWLANRVELRQLLFVPKGEPEGYDYIPGPYVKCEASPLVNGQNAYYAVLIELPEDTTEGGLDIPLKVIADDKVQQEEMRFRVLPLELGRANWRFSLFSGPHGNDQLRQAFYRDMAAMGLDFPAIYNLSPCDLAYENGELVISFERFEHELQLLREGGLLRDDSPMLIDMRFVEAYVTILSNKLNDSPELRRQTVTLGRFVPDQEPNETYLEEMLFMQVLEAIRTQSSARNDLWPARMLLMPQDEIEWGRIEQTQRFGRLIKKAGFETISTSDGVRWGWDGLERLDEVIDYRVYGYVNQDVLDVTNKSHDTFSLYTYPHDFVIGWAYFPSKFDLDSVMKWTYYWPVGKYYKNPGKMNPSSGTSFVWPGVNAALPSGYTFEISEATRDAAMVRLCLETIDRGGKTTEACFKKIQGAMPIDVKVLGQQLGQELPRGNVPAWRQVMCAALLNDLSAEKVAEGERQ